MFHLLFWLLFAVTYYAFKRIAVRWGNLTAQTEDGQTNDRTDVAELREVMTSD